MASIDVVCRSCQNTGLEKIISFGRTPLADRLLTRDQLQYPEITASLDLVFCSKCGLVQTTETIPREILFGRDELYQSYDSPPSLRNFAASTAEIIAACKLGPKSFVIEPESNDGYILKNFVEAGIPVLGIDSLQWTADVAHKRGVPTLSTDFTKDLAARFRAYGLLADVVLAHNVLSHVADLNDFVEGIRIVLKDDGMAVIDVPYLVDLIVNCAIDAFGHRRLCYFSVTTLFLLFRRHGLYLKDIRHVDIHGGSLRLFVGRRRGSTETVARMLRAERNAGVSSLSFFRSFADRVVALGARLRDMLWDLKCREYRIAAYGAVAEATTLLSYVGIDGLIVDYVVEVNPDKLGKFMPGNHLPILPPDRLVEDQPDYVLLLARDCVDENIQQWADYRRRGGQVIVPIPNPHII